MTDFLPGFIVDLSHWNQPLDEPDFEAAKAVGCLGVVAKYTQGRRVDDDMAMQHAYNAHSAGIPLLGGYHFGDNSDPLLQAKHFLAQVKADFPSGIDGVELMLDWEGNGTNTMTPEQRDDFLKAVFGDIGRWPLLYTGRFGTGRGFFPSDATSHCDLVLAGYGPYIDLSVHLPQGVRMPKDDADRGGVCRFWQFTDGTTNGGPIAGLGRVDQWKIVGFSSFEALRARWGH